VINGVRAMGRHSIPRASWATACKEMGVDSVHGCAASHRGVQPAAAGSSRSYLAASSFLQPGDDIATHILNTSGKWVTELGPSAQGAAAHHSVSGRVGPGLVLMLGVDTRDRPDLPVR